MKRRRHRTAKTRTVYVKAPRRRARARKRNPAKASRARRAARRAGAFARTTFGGMNIKGALKNVPASVLGMMAAKWSAKRFGEGKATETDPESWAWSEYLKGAAGGFVAGFLMQMVKPGTGQKVLEGALNLMAYKLVENELVPKSEWATQQFGQETQDAAIQYDEQGTPFLLGQDGSVYPVDERHRTPLALLGDEIVRPGSLGDELSRPGRLGDAWDDAYLGATGSGERSNDPFAKAFFG